MSRSGVGVRRGVGLEPGRITVGERTGAGVLPGVGVRVGVAVGDGRGVASSSGVAVGDGLGVAVGDGVGVGVRRLALAFVFVLAGRFALLLTFQSKMSLNPVFVLTFVFTLARFALTFVFASLPLRVNSQKPPAPRAINAVVPSIVKITTSAVLGPFGGGA